MDLVQNMKNCFLRFKQEHQHLNRPPSNESARSDMSRQSINSIRSQRFVKIRKGSVKTDKDELIAKLQAQNEEKDQRIQELERKLLEALNR